MITYAADVMFWPSFLAFGVLALAIIGLVNIPLNWAIVYVITRVFNKKPGKKQASWRDIAIISFIGAAIDVFAFITVFIVFSSNASNYWLYSIITGVIVFALVSIVGYALVFNKILKEAQAKKAAILFGIASNPIWILLLAPLFTIY